MHSRRDLLLRGSAMVGGVAVLAGLSGCIGGSAQTAADVQNGVGLVVNGAKAIVNAMAALPNVSPALLQSVNNELSIVLQNANNIANAATAPNVTSAIQQALGIIAAVATPLFPPAAAIIPVISAGISLIAILVNEVGGSSAPAPASLRMRAMSRAQAEKILQAL